MDTLWAMIFHLQTIAWRNKNCYEQLLNVCNLVEPKIVIGDNSPSIWTNNDFESLSVEVLNHSTRWKLAYDFILASLFK